MVTFEQFWQLLYDHGSSNYYQNEVYSRWSSLTPDHQQQLFDRIWQKIADGRFVSFNPLEAVHDNLPRRRALYRQTLTYSEYYSTFRTTNPTNGWRMEKDANGKVFYSKTQHP